MKSSGRARSPRGLDGWVSPATETRPPARTGPVGARQRFLCPPFHVFCPFVPFGWLLSFSRSGWGTWSGGGAAAACGGVPQGAPVRLRAWATAGATENDQQCALESHRPPAASSVVAGYAPPTADAAALNSTRGRVFIRHRSGLCWRRPSPALRFARCARQPSGPRLVTSHARRAGVCRYRHPPPPPPPRGRCRTAHCGTVAPAAASLPAPPCNPLVQLVVRTRAAGMCRQSANGTGLYHCAVLAQRLAVTVPITSSLFSPHPPHPLPEPSLWLSL